MSFTLGDRPFGVVLPYMDAEVALLLRFIIAVRARVRRGFAPAFELLVAFERALPPIRPAARAAFIERPGPLERRPHPRKIWNDNYNIALLSGRRWLVKCRRYWHTPWILVLVIVAVFSKRKTNESHEKKIFFIWNISERSERHKYTIYFAFQCKIKRLLHRTGKKKQNKKYPLKTKVKKRGKKVFLKIK